MKTQHAVAPTISARPQWLTLLPFLLGIFMGALDHGIVGPALSSIFTAFQIEASWGVWSLTIYTLLFAVSIPILGKISDRVGRKQTFTFGITVFAIGSLLAALAPNFLVFLLGRAVQAIGAGGIFPITAAHIAASYPPDKRGKIMGLIGVAFGLGSILGPMVGGLMVAKVDWQWIFLMNLPISALILFLMTGFTAEQETVKKPIDGAGIIVLSLMIVAIMLGISSGEIVIIMAGVILLPILISIEKKHPDPVVNLKYFTQRNTIVILVSSLISGFVMATASHFVPLYAESMLGLAKGNAGLSVTPLAIASTVASLAGGMMTDKFGAKRTLQAGFILSLTGAVLLTSVSGSFVTFIISLIVIGFGVGIIVGAPLNMLIIQAVGMKEMGAAVGYISLLRSIGSTLGPATAGKMIDSFASGFTYVYLSSAAASAIAIVLLVVVQKQKQAEA